MDRVFLGAKRRPKVVLLTSVCLVLIIAQSIWLYSSWRSHSSTSKIDLKNLDQTALPWGGETTFLNSSVPIVPCRGPRGGLLNDPVTQDLPHGFSELENFTFPEPSWGSFDALNLEKTWMSFKQRYGPYGFGQDNEDYAFEKVQWDEVNWGMLQRECAVQNEARLGQIPRLQDDKDRFRYQADGKAPERLGKTGRQAIILRGWTSFDYTPEDMWNIRSLIVEASLASGGEYEVILLLDVKDDEKGPLVHKDPAVYRQVVEESVPPEFRDIVVLFHSSLQRDLYAKVEEWEPFWQIMQPLQLVGHFFPEFDQFWQIEMDTRFTGDSGKILRAFSDFGKASPYKQSRERASWSYMPELMGSWDDFTKNVNTSLEGGAAVWGPVENTPVYPVKRPPPMEPFEDDFKIGVGVDADLLLYSPLNEVSRFRSEADWRFMNWIKGIPNESPRFMAIPAQARASWELLEAIHVAQHDHGIRIHSEATLPTFALWNGLKVVGVPMPVYQRPVRDPRELFRMLNGHYPQESPQGVANGLSRYGGSLVNFFHKQNTWDWWGTLPNNIFEYWIGSGKSKPGATMFPPDKEGDPFRLNIEDELPWFMAEVKIEGAEYNDDDDGGSSGQKLLGETYAPGFMIHPRKTN